VLSFTPPDHVVICLTTLSDGIAPNVWLILWNKSERVCEVSQPLPRVSLEPGSSQLLGFSWNIVVNPVVRTCFEHFLAFLDTFI